MLGSDTPRASQLKSKPEVDEASLNGRRVDGPVRVAFFSPESLRLLVTKGNTDIFELLKMLNELLRKTNGSLIGVGKVGELGYLRLKRVPVGVRLVELGTLSCL